MMQENNNSQNTNTETQLGQDSQQKVQKASEPNKTSYAVRPDHRHHRRLAFSDQDNMLQTRNYLNIGFMLLAIVGVILWTQLEESRTPAIIVLIIAVALKIAEVCIRLFKK